MKIGVIIIFNNNEKDINVTEVIHALSNTKHISFCFVNNCSTDNTLNVLQELKEESNNVTVIDIKKLKSTAAAVKAGARFMFSNFDIKNIGYAVSSEIAPNSLTDFIENVNLQQKQIVEQNKVALKKAEIKPTLFQSIFAIDLYLKDEVNL